MCGFKWLPMHLFFILLFDFMDHRSSRRRAWAVAQSFYILDVDRTQIVRAYQDARITGSEAYCGRGLVVDDGGQRLLGRSLLRRWWALHPVRDKRDHTGCRNTDVDANHSRFELLRSRLRI